MASVEVVEDCEKEIEVIARLMRLRLKHQRRHGRRDWCCGERQVAWCSMVESTANKNAVTAIPKMIRIQISLAFMSSAACQRMPNDRSAELRRASVGELVVLRH